MKRKSTRDDALVVSKELLDRARQALETELDTFKRPVKCSVCGSDCASTPSDEQLCWVCRRLKISAWRDADVQMPAQE